MANISTDSNDSAVSSLSWAGGSSFDGSVKGGQPNDRKVTFQEDGRGRTYLLPQTVPERPARGPLAKFQYVGHNKTAPTQQYAPMPYGGNGNPGEPRTYTSLPNIQHMPSNSYQADSGLSDEDCNGNQGNKLKGILKNADEPILRCIQENLERYEEDPPSWVRDKEAGDLTSEDGSVTTMSGSYVLDPSEKQAKLSPRHGFSVWYQPIPQADISELTPVRLHPVIRILNFDHRLITANLRILLLGSPYWTKRAS